MSRQRLRSLAMSAAIFALAGPAVAEPGVDGLRGGEIWRHCEHYYLSVQRYEAEDDHYAIKDISLEFMKTIRRFKPRTKTEAALYAECVNLANGNATLAHDTILREEAEDDEFFDLALNDATNNSNASQFEYMSDIDDRYQLEQELALARETFRSTLEVERAQSMTKVLQFFGQDIQFSFGSGGGGFVQYFPTYGYSTSQASSWSGGGGSSNNAAGATLAPVTSSGQSGGSASGSSASGASSPATGSGASPSAPGQVAVVPTEPPDQAAPERAWHLDSSCASYRMSSEDPDTAVIENRCAGPITVHYCWVPKGKSGCKPNLVSNIIAARSAGLIPGPAEDEQRIAEYVVCDMSDPQRVCMQ